MHFAPGPCVRCDTRNIWWSMISLRLHRTDFDLRPKYRCSGYETFSYYKLKFYDRLLLSPHGSAINVNARGLDSSKIEYRQPQPFTRFHSSPLLILLTVHAHYVPMSTLCTLPTYIMRTYSTSHFCSSPRKDKQIDLCHPTRRGTEFSIIEAFLLSNTSPKRIPAK